MNELALFAGAGGGLLASNLNGWSTRCAVEIEKYPREVLLHRQQDGCLDRFPIWDDVNTFEGKPWAGHIDIITGGFPCQDISAAGKGAGITGERSGLWKEYKRIVNEVGPKFVFAENSPLLRSRGLGTVLKDLDELGYDCRWCVLGAWHLGGPHKRNRMWVLGYKRQLISNSKGSHQRTAREKPESDSRGDNAISDAALLRLEDKDLSFRRGKAHAPADSYHRWPAEPPLDRVADGLADEPHANNLIGDENDKEWSLSAMSTFISNSYLLDVWGNGDPSETPPGWEPEKQHLRECRGSLPIMPHEETHGAGGLGEGHDCTSELCHLWRQIQAEANAKGYALWKEGMPFRKWQASGGKAMVYVPRISTACPNRVKSIKALGNGQIPIVAATAWRILSEGLIEPAEVARD